MRWIERLIGPAAPRRSELKTLLASYPPYRIPFPGSGRGLTLDQATANLGYLLQHKADRLAAIRSLLARFDIDLSLGLGDKDPQNFLNALWQWTAVEWPSVYDAALASPARFDDSARDGPEIIFSLIQDVAIVLGEVVLARRSDYRWALDLDPENRGTTKADGMRSWQRPVLLRPADTIVPIILFDFEAIARTAYVACAKPGYQFQRDMVQSVLDALSGAHERFWRTDATRGEASKKD